MRLIFVEKIYFEKNSSYDFRFQRDQCVLNDNIGNNKIVPANYF